ncbi:helix-turn-helix domain-containing protein [Streptomyces endophyticus]|uniref:Helix-turn-helix domain-containing protein n=1 Tax=Streptomyces endophyticus TaxID=714166 RepID=A0ABU6F496_9ACTN|nr:helix-turn-helix domain-containing protein [Streptomyces endophyticus]MEB8338674.1 helix-turn-helix domain-containing protein [Streptomyces endophyticus]
MTQGAATPLPPPKERRRLREAGSLSRDEVAERVGVTRETVRRWEAGRTTPKGQKREAYARLLAELTDAEEPSPTTAPMATAPTTTAPTTARPVPEAAAIQEPAPPTAAATATAVAEQEPAPAPEPVAAATRAGTAAEAFDALYTHAAPFLVRQTYLLTGRRILAREAVERAFQQAWQNWPEVAVDPDPAGWVRAAAYEYAMSPWHGLRPGKRQPEAPPATPEDRELLGALLDLPPVYRRTLLLYDGVGLDLPETAAETEASTPAAANRILHAREAVARRLPDLAVPEQLHQRLTELAGSEKLDAPVSTVVRSGGERRTRLWTRAAVAFTVFIIGATALTVRVAPTHYEPVPAPGSPIAGVPPLTGPEPLTPADLELRKELRDRLSGGPERLTPRTE